MINVAMINGARKAIACEALGLSVRTIQRWYDWKVANYSKMLGLTHLVLHPPISC